MLLHDRAMPLLSAPEEGMEVLESCDFWIDMMKET